VDSAGNLYISDTGNSRIRMVAASTGIITTIAGNGTQGYNGDNIPATGAEMNAPKQVKLDHAGNLYITDSGNNRIRMVTASTGFITTIAGNGVNGFSGDGGVATSAALGDPESVAVNSGCYVFFVDSGNSRVRSVGGSNSPCF